jgi:hypothetical protein
MDLSTLGRALRRHPVAAVITFVIVLGVALLGAFVPTQKYESTSVLAVQPVSVSGSEASDLTTFLIPTIQAQIASDTMKASIRSSLDGSAKSASWTASSTNDPGSGVLRVRVSTTDKADAATITDAYASALIASPPGDGKLAISSVDKAKVPSSASFPPRSTLYIAGVGGGIILACLVALAMGSGPDRRRRAHAALESPRQLEESWNDSPATTSSHALSTD